MATPSRPPRPQRCVTPSPAPWPRGWAGDRGRYRWLGVTGGGLSPGTPSWGWVGPAGEAPAPEGGTVRAARAGHGGVTSAVAGGRGHGHPARGCGWDRDGAVGGVVFFFFPFPLFTKFLSAPSCLEVPAEPQWGGGAVPALGGLPPGPTWLKPVLMALAGSVVLMAVPGLQQCPVSRVPCPVSCACREPRRGAGMARGGQSAACPQGGARAGGGQRGPPQLGRMGWAEPPHGPGAVWGRGGRDPAGRELRVGGRTSGSAQLGEPGGAGPSLPPRFPELPPHGGPGPAARVSGCL